MMTRTALVKAVLGTTLLLHAGRAATADELSPVGRWRTFDPVTKEPRSIVEITEAGGELQGRVTTRFPPPGDPTHGVSSGCDGARKDQPILGMVILWSVKRQGDGWGGGGLLAPNTGKTYSVNLHLDDHGRTLLVHAYVGLPMFGQTVTWARAD
jgi:uncharacterized protein (DUF2147 family)